MKYPLTDGKSCEMPRKAQICKNISVKNMESRMQRRISKGDISKGLWRCYCVISLGNKLQRLMHASTMSPGRVILTKRLLAKLNRFKEVASNGKKDYFRITFFILDQVWPLTQIFFCFLFVKSPGPPGKSMTPHQGNTILFRSSQQLPRLCLRPLKGFLS